MQDRDAGIPLDGCMIDNVLYHNCFSGKYFTTTGILMDEFIFLKK